MASFGPSLLPTLSPSPEVGLGNIINAADCDYRLLTTDYELTDDVRKDGQYSTGLVNEETVLRWSHWSKVLHLNLECHTNQ